MGKTIKKKKKKKRKKVIRYCYLTSSEHLFSRAPFNCYVYDLRHVPSIF